MRRLASVITFCVASATAFAALGQQSAAPPLSHYHAVTGYWRDAAKAFEDGAAAATSETKKSVWIELAAYFARGAAHFEELAEADDKAIAAAKQRAASPGAAGSLPPGPRALTPVQPLQVKPVMPTIGVPASPQQTQVSPIGSVIAAGEQCRKDAEVFADGLSFDELMRRKRRFEQCHVPELRAWADYDRARARDALTRAEAVRQPAADNAACGWNCPGQWQENQTDREKELLKRESDLYSEVADRLSSQANAIDSGATDTMPTASPADHPVTMERATASLCPALEKLPPQANGNDPYLLCDCFDAYLHGRLAGHYADMLKRSERYLLSPAPLSATPATVTNVRPVTERFHWSFPDAFLIDIAKAAPIEADRYACHFDLRGYEVDRVLASWPREIVAGSGLIPASPMQTATELNALHQTVYQGVRDRITALWLKYISEVNLGTLKIAYEQAEFDWTLRYKSGAELKTLYDTLIGSQTNPINWHPYLDKKEELCARDNEASYARLRDTSVALLDVAGAFRTARTRFAADLLEWQALADRDGWPRLPNDPSLKTMADRLWQSSDLSRVRKPHDKEQVTTSIEVPTPLAGSVEYRDPATGSNATDEVSVFYRSHHSCSLWMPDAPPFGLYMTAWPKPVLSQDMAVDPQIANDIAPSWSGYFGPLTQATLRRENSRIELFAHLFERASQALEAYYSGADASQSP